MRLGIVFQGECRNKDNVVRAVQRMAKEKGYRVGAWKEGMRVVLCPTGYVDLGWVPVRSFFGRWKITGSCVSVPAGPGFHRAAAELIQALGEKEIKDMEWKDSTGYLEDPDFEALRRDTFEPWLAEQLNQALEELDRDAFDHAVKAIVSAKRIYIIGVRSSAAIASFLGFYFNLIFDNVVNVTAGTASEMFEHLLRVGEDDVVIGVSFPRYSSRTVQAMSFARDRKATTVAITDSEASPLAPICKYTLKARSDMASFGDSLVAPLSLVNALLVAVSRAKNDDLANTFQTLERIWEDYGVYEKVQE